MPTDTFPQFRLDSEGAVVSSANGRLVIRRGKLNPPKDPAAMGGLGYHINRFAYPNRVHLELSRDRLSLDIVARISGRETFRLTLVAIDYAALGDFSLDTWLAFANRELGGRPH